jgi:hypothetical protein
MTTDDDHHDLSASYEDIEGFLSGRFSSTLLMDNIRPTVLDLAYLEEHGRFYPSPSSYGHPGLREGRCYKSCASLLEIFKGLRYVQGFVCSRSDRIIYPHSWCTDEKGQCIDITWDKRFAGHEYFGVAFTRKQLLKLLEHYGTNEWYEGFADVLARTDLIDPQHPI